MQVTGMGGNTVYVWRTTEMMLYLILSGIVHFALASWGHFPKRCCGVELGCCNMAFFSCDAPRPKRGTRAKTKLSSEVGTISSSGPEIE